jgi:hypothetical protein
MKQMRNRIISALGLTTLVSVSLVNALPAGSASNHAKGTPSFSTYCNAKYGYCVDYPSYLHGEGESDAADGQKFSSPSDPLKIAAWGNWSNWQSGDDMTINQERDWDLKNQSADEPVTYKAMGKSWFVFSGTSKEGIFYRRTVKGKDTFATVVITYPANKKAAYDSVVQRIARSLRAH